MQRLIILQGAPGSGKSTHAQLFARYRPNTFVCSTDDFFYINDEYRFCPEMLAYFHSWNVWEVTERLKEGQSVIVDNCNIRQWHAQPYIDAAKALGVKITILRFTAQRENVHRVPEKVVQRMRREMEVLRT